MSTNFQIMSNNIKNGQISRKAFVFSIKTKICENLLKILWGHNFIIGYKSNNNLLKIFLKYKKNKPVIFSLKNLSKPSYKLYFNVKQIWKLNLTNSIFIFSTSKGLLSLPMCKIENIGGELILVIN